jgi:hypothetical protein
MWNIDGTAAIMDVNNKGIACNAGPTPPAMLATVRAGSNIDFVWTKWLPSHQGPLITYMAPYEGDISKVDVNQLKFFKIHEVGEYPNGSWSTDKMISDSGAWNTTVPWDIKPGKYIVRHELIALLFATKHSNYSRIPGSIVAPQSYVSCYNVEVTGNGTVTPPGVKFPGAYEPKDPGLNFDIFVNNRDYPIPGPKVYKPSGPAPKLTPNPIKVISATGDSKQDDDYVKSMAKELKQWETITDFFQSIGG